MNDRDKRRYDMFNRVQTFGDDNGADFAAGSVGQTNFSSSSAAFLFYGTLGGIVR